MKKTTLKPLIAKVLVNQDTASISVFDDKGNPVIGPLTHHHLSSMADPVQTISEHIQQLKSRGINIVVLESELPGVKLN